MSDARGPYPASEWRRSFAGIGKFSLVVFSLCGNWVTWKMDLSFYDSATRWWETVPRVEWSMGMLRALLPCWTGFWRKSLEQERWSRTKLWNFPANCISRIRGAASWFALVGFSPAVCFGICVVGTCPGMRHSSKRRTQLPLGWRNLPNGTGMVSLVQFVLQSRRCSFTWRSGVFSFPYNPPLVLQHCSWICILMGRNHYINAGSGFDLPRLLFWSL